MKIYCNMKTILLPALFLFLGTGLSGQPQTRPEDRYFAGIQERRLNFSLSSPTFSSSAFEARPEWSEVGLYTHYETGALHRVQTGESIHSMGFSSEGSFRDGRLFLYGKFNFCQEKKNRVRFTSHLEPYRGTPYDLADTLASDWKVQNYDVAGKMAYELVPGLLSMGLEGKIEVARGAKQIDPRPRTNNNSIEFTPSLSLHAGGHVLSIGGSYDLFRENMNMILYNASEPQKLYEFKGLGQYTYSIFSTTSRDRKYGGNGLSGVLSYQYEKQGNGVFLSGKYRNYGETASDMDNGKLKDLGKFFSDQWTFQLRAHFRSSRLVQSLDLEYFLADQSGREYFQVFDPSEGVNDWVTESEFPQRFLRKTQSVSGKYGLDVLKGDGSYPVVSVELEARHDRSDEQYRVMKTFRNLETWSFGLAPQYNFFWSKRWFSSVGVEAGYRLAQHFSDHYTGRKPGSDVVEREFYAADSGVLCNDVFQVGGHWNLGWSLKNGNAFTLDLGYRFRNAVSPQEVLLSRHLVTVSFRFNW